jgi:four helix bundle protein
MSIGPLHLRTKALARDTLRFLDTLPRAPGASIIAGQLGRSAASVGANYRRACLAQSPRDFIAKLKVVEEEADEANYWLDLAVELKLGNELEGVRLRKETQEIRAMIIASIRTLRASGNSRLTK